MTAASVVLAALAAGAFAVASRPAMVAGAVLLYLGFVLDCVDGQLARYTRRFSAFGGWLDTMADRAKEYAVYAGLAAGQRAGLAEAWSLAIAAMALQTVRHMTDTWYGVAARRGGAPAAAGAAASGGVGDRLSAASDRVQADAGSVAYWLKRIVVFPIGERWAPIALTAALFDGRVGADRRAGLGRARVRVHPGPADPAVRCDAGAGDDHGRHSGTATTARWSGTCSAGCGSAARAALAAARAGGRWPAAGLVLVRGDW